MSNTSFDVFQSWKLWNVFEFNAVLLHDDVWTQKEALRHEDLHTLAGQANIS